jgi:uncharacterized protein
MMSVKAKLSADMKEAMRAKDKKTTSVLRMILSEMQYAKTAAGSDGNDLDDVAALKVVAAYNKRLKKSLSDYPDGEMKDAIVFEMSIAERYLPKKASEEEVRTVVEKIMAANEGAHFGVIMKATLAELGDAGDGGLVSKVIKELQA